jgi:Zinc-finger double-stranded RNA-binding/Zinc-finger of C2H2 type
MPCNRRFESEEALQQHLRDSPAHAWSFDCDDCDRSFESEEALQQHLRDPRIHQQDTETTLDVFSRSFPTFDYEPSLPPATSYANLREHEGWRRGSAASNDVWNRYQDAL